MTLSTPKPLVKREGIPMLCRIFGHRWYAIGYGTVRCMRCWVSGSQSENLKVTNLRFDRLGFSRGSK